MYVLVCVHGYVIRVYITGIHPVLLAVPQMSSRKSSTLTKNKVLFKRRNLILALVVSGYSSIIIQCSACYLVHVVR